MPYDSGSTKSTRTVIHVADKPIARETSQDWNTHVSFAADGTVVEVVILEARAHGAFPVKQQAA